MTTPEDALRLASLALAQVGAIKANSSRELHHQAVKAVEQALATLARTPSGQAEDAARLDWIRDNLFLHRWNGVIGPGWRNDWSIVPNYRRIHIHDESGNTGGDFRAAIDAAMACSAKGVV